MMNQPSQGQQASPKMDHSQFQPNYQQSQPGYPSRSGYLQQTMLQQQPMSQPPAPQKKPKTWLWTIACFVCLFVGYAAGNGSHSTTDTTSTASQATVATNNSVSTQSTKPTHAPTKPAQWKTTQTFSGDGNKKTNTFTVADSWKLIWKCDPASFNGMQYNIIVTVYGSDNTTKDLAINTLCKSGNTGGETEEHAGGPIYLDVSSEGSWNLSIQELK